MFSFFEKKKNTGTDNTMSSFDIVKKLLLNINKDLDPDIIMPDVLLEDLGLDSIKFLNILLSMEDILEMDLESFIEKIDLSEIIKVNDLVSVIDKFKSKP